MFVCFRHWREELTSLSVIIDIQRKKSTIGEKEKILTIDKVRKRKKSKEKKSGEKYRQSTFIGKRKTKTYTINITQNLKQ